MLSTHVLLIVFGAVAALSLGTLAGIGIGKLAWKTDRRLMARRKLYQSIGSFLARIGLSDDAEVFNDLAIGDLTDAVKAEQKIINYYTTPESQAARLNAIVLSVATTAGPLLALETKQRIAKIVADWKLPTAVSG